MGFFEKLLGRTPCPKCGNAISIMVFGPDGALCKCCDTYVTKVHGIPVPVEPSRVANEPWFGSPLPWPDMRAVQPGPVLDLSAETAALRMFTTQDAGVRRLEAAWPGGCCVCGKPSVRTETVAQKVTIPRFAGRLNVGDQTLTLVAENIPYCAEHHNGVAFGRVIFATAISEIPYGLLFRSLTYRNAFRTLNPWHWPDQ